MEVYEQKLKPAIVMFVLVRTTIANLCPLKPSISIVRAISTSDKDDNSNGQTVVRIF